MEGSFKSKKIIAVVVATISGLSVLYSLFIPKDDLILKVDILITARKPELHSAKVGKGHKHYWVEFRFTGNRDSPYRLQDGQLKNSLYHDLMNDIKAYDTLLIKSDQENMIYSIVCNGKSYVDEAEALKWREDNRRFLIFFRIVICFACLPILFVKRQPTFWHSGFEFEFRFTFLFVAILVISICIYFYCHRAGYLAEVDPTRLS